MTATATATYVTQWADGTELSSECSYDAATAQVSDIKPVDVVLDPTLELTDEFVLLADGTKAPIKR